MQVILLERVDNLGAMGDVVEVKPGFARNFLLPRERALRATKANMARFEAEREFLEKRNAEAAQKARDEGGHMDGESYVMIRKAGETGMLYGSVSARDIAEIVGSGVTRGMVKLMQPIKALGVTPVAIRLHADVEVTVNINVARTEDEAERQAKGEDVIATQMDEEKADEAEAAAERAELAHSMFEGDAPSEAIIGEEEPEAATEAVAEATGAEPKSEEE